MERPSKDEYDYAAKRAKEDSAKAMKTGAKADHQEAADAHRVAASKGDSKEAVFHAAERAKHEKLAAQGKPNPLKAWVGKK